MELITKVIKNYEIDGFKEILFDSFFPIVNKGDNVLIWINFQYSDNNGRYNNNISLTLERVKNLLNENSEALLILAITLITNSDIYCQNKVVDFEIALDKLISKNNLEKSLENKKEEKQKIKNKKI